MTIHGRVWLFGDEINTDFMFPHTAFHLPVEEQLKLVFSDNRPGWVDLVLPGDVIIAGSNFGTGSSRPGALQLRRLGISCLVADSFNGLFFRNCFGYGLAALQCQGAASIFKEGETAVIDLLEGTVMNEITGKIIRGNPLSQSIIDIVKAGGLEELLIKEGYMEAKV